MKVRKFLNLLRRERLLHREKNPEKSAFVGTEKPFVEVDENDSAPIDPLLQAKLVGGLTDQF